LKTADEAARIHVPSIICGWAARGTTLVYVMPVKYPGTRGRQKSLKELYKF